MAQTLKKLDETITLSAENALPVPLQDEKKPWHRQEGESALWFNRFQRYRKLGPKRSLQAAVEQEHKQVKALKSPLKSATKKRGLLQTVANTRVQVSGSWKVASVTWRWVERAHAWDAWQIDQMVQEQLDELHSDTQAFSYARIRTLDSMVHSLGKIFNQNVSHMSIQEICAMSAQMQSLIKDIRKEMEGYDEAAARVILSYNATKLYNNLDEELAKRDKK